MIRCNLAVLLVERNLKITKVSNDTGISRTTLTSLSSNSSQGIQFDTLNALCMYLNVRPEDFFSFVSVNIKVNTVEIENSDITISFTVEENNKESLAQLKGSFSKDDNNSCFVSIDLLSDNNIGYQENVLLINSLRQLPRPFLSDLELQIKIKIALILADIPSIFFHWGN